MSYALYATEYRQMPNVVDVAVRPLDSRGEPKGEQVEDVKAIVGDGVAEGLSGQAIGVTGDTARIVIFVESLPQPVELAPMAVIIEADGTMWSVINCQLRVFKTRWVCDCRRHIERG